MRKMKDLSLAELIGHADTRFVETFEKLDNLDGEDTYNNRRGDV